MRYYYGRYNEISYEEAEKLLDEGCKLEYMTNVRTYHYLDKNSMSHVIRNNFKVVQREGGNQAYIDQLKR